MNVNLKLSGYLEESTIFCLSMIDAINDDTCTGIIVLVDSPGGNTNCISPIVEMFKLANLCGKQVITVGLGTIASSAGSIFVAGNRRILLPNAEFLIHRARIGISNDQDTGASDLKDLYARTVSATDVVLSNIYSFTKITPEIVEEKLRDSKDWYLTPEEIKEYGVTTEDYRVETLKEIFVDNSKSLTDKVKEALEKAGMTIVEEEDTKEIPATDTPDFVAELSEKVKNLSYYDDDHEFDDECDYEGD